VYLFTNRPRISPMCTGGISTTSMTMRYESFVQALRPAIAERLSKHGNFPHDRAGDSPKGTSQREEGASVIDQFNYFFQRAVANSDQIAFNQESSAGKDILQRSDKERGKAILTQIRSNLRTFCSFQPRTHGLWNPWGA